MNKLSDSELRGWSGVPYALVHKGDNRVVTLTEEEFYELLDTAEGDQCYRYFDNICTPEMEWEITGRCNYNCIHCFNAVDENPIYDEFTLEEGRRLISEAEACGIYTCKITGGEPLMHKEIIPLWKEMHDHGIRVVELNTNGMLLNEKFLNELKNIGANPLIKISFDGLGYHDRMRGYVGAEEAALKAIKLCIENGFETMAQMNLNRENIDTILPSLELLDSMGVTKTRIIRTTETPRLNHFAPKIALPIDEYYDCVINILKQYITKPHSMDIIAWQFILLNVRDKKFKLPALMRYATYGYDDRLPICSDALRNIAIAANGNVYPCMQSSGSMEALGITLGNVKKDGLKPILQQGRYVDFISRTVSDRIAANEKCSKCEFRYMCTAGCPASGAIASGSACDFMHYDPWKCVFFEKEYYKKCEVSFSGYENTTAQKELCI